MNFASFTPKQKILTSSIALLLFLLIGGGYVIFNKNHHSSAAFVPPAAPPLTNSTRISLNIQENGQPAFGKAHFDSPQCPAETGGTDGFFYCTSPTTGITFSDITFTSFTSGITYTIVPGGGDSDENFTVDPAAELILDATLQQDGTNPSGSEISLKKWVNGDLVDTNDGTELAL